jgi:hypothetical protein
LQLTLAQKTKRDDPFEGCPGRQHAIGLTKGLGGWGLGQICEWHVPALLHEPFVG